MGSHDIGVREGSRIAVLDWDGTLRPGWTLPDWIGYLVDVGVLDRSAQGRIARPFSRYRAGELSHDGLAAEANDLYAVEMKGVRVQAVTDLMPAFIAEDRGRIFPFVHDLLALLSRHDVATVVLSGAPAEILRAHAPLIPSAGVIGLAIHQRVGLFSGTVELNPGLSNVKATYLRKFELMGYKLAVGIGNSVSDTPILTSSEIAVVVGSGVSGLFRKNQIQLRANEKVGRELDQLDQLLSRFSRKWHQEHER